jgi:Concanavalin A-like lectin/glucanases superfamily
MIAMFRPLRGCALVLTVALLVPVQGGQGGEAPVDPLLPPVVPVTPPVTPPPATPVTAAPVTPVTKALAAVPTDAAQAEALKTLKAAFKEEFAARRKAEDRQIFARVLLEQGHTTTDDVERFVVLSEASAQAAKAGDHTTVLAAQDALAAQFTVNARELRLAALADVAPNLPTEEAANATLEAMLLLAEVGIAKDDYPFTTRACKEADGLARRLNNAPLMARVKTIADRAKFLADEFKKMGPVEEDLLGSLTPESHLRLGQFLCFAKGDWQSGLPHLAECSDATLQAAASNELSASSDPAASVGPLKIADGWYELGQKQRKAAKEEIYVHALVWYRRAAPGLKGPAKLKLEKRIDELSRALEATGRLIRYPAGATLLLTFERETLSGQGASLTHVLDISGHNLRANATGPLTVESGNHGLALRCDGKSWLTVSNSAELQVTGNHTIAFWMCPDSLTVRRSPFHKGYTNENSLVLEIDGSLNYLYGNGTTYQAFALPAAGVAKKWTHVALTRDIAAKRLIYFMDGRRVSEAVLTYPMVAPSTTDQLIGSGYTSPFLGLMDDVGLWPRALSEAEIRQMYEATATGR